MNCMVTGAGGKGGDDDLVIDCLRYADVWVEVGWD